LHTLRESDALAAKLRHRPGEPGRLQLRQAPAQLLSQQTPSTHSPDPHSAASVQSCPICFLPQESFPVASFAHARPGAQSESTLQAALQEPLLHKYGKQSMR
jgi:hypothetical protein